MAEATLLISSKNYSSWSPRGFLLARMSGLDFQERPVSPDDVATRAERQLQASSIRVPCLVHDDIREWDTPAIAEYLNEIRPMAQMLPQERIAWARCRSVSGEMHAGFSALRSTLPMNLRSHWPGFTVRRLGAGGHRADHRDLARLPRHLGGPWLLGRMLGRPA